MWWSTVGVIVTLTLSLLVASRTVEAQPAKVPRIGYVRPNPGSPCRHNAFAEGLRALGYREGHTIVTAWRCADGTPAQARGLAVELVPLPVDVFVGEAADGPLAARQATRTIPIVFAVVAAPVAMGLGASWAQPGGNVTGVASQVGLACHAKRLHLLLAAVPRVTRGAALQPGASVRALPGRARQQQAVAAAARSLGVHLQMVEVDTPDELAGAFAAMTREGAAALLVFQPPFFVTHGKRLVELATMHRLPSISACRGQVGAGGRMSYNAHSHTIFRRAASYVDRILKGAKPAALPVEPPTQCELVMTLKTAEALGLTIPPTLLCQADEVIK
jgi:putative ABC transport system substrate-binding protein